MIRLPFARSFMAAGIAAIALSGLSIGTAVADVITFDPDGIGGNAPVQLATIDYQVGNGVFVGLGPAAVPKLGQPFTFVYQARIGNLLDASSNVIPVAGLNQPGGFELTAIFAFDGVANGTSNPTVYSLTPGLNYFRLFYDNNPLTKANDLAGTGFDDGTAILAGQFSAADGSFSIIPVAPLPLFDGFGADNYGGLQSLLSAGGADFTVGGLAVDPNFFITAPPQLQLHLANSSDITPFDQANPSHVFQPNFLNYIPALGPANGMGGDFQVQADANGSFTRVPEPASLVLAGLGSLGLILIGRRRIA